MSRKINLNKTGEEASVEVLGAQDLADVVALQEVTRSALPVDQKMFVLPQKPDYFLRFLTNINGLMIGIRVKGQLVAQMVVMGKLTLGEAIDRDAITRNKEIPFHHAHPADLVVVAKSMAVHPDWRGYSLSQHLLEAALEQPIARMSDHVFAQISVENIRSWEIFLNNGFGIVAAALCPSDGKPRFVLQKPRAGLSMHQAASADGLDPVANFSSIIGLTGRAALIGRIDEYGPGLRLAFHSATDKAAAWVEDEEVMGV